MTDDSSGSEDRHIPVHPEETIEPEETHRQARQRANEEEVEALIDEVVEDNEELGYRRKRMVITLYDEGEITEAAARELLGDDLVDRHHAAHEQLQRMFDTYGDEDREGPNVRLSYEADYGWSARHMPSGIASQGDTEPEALRALAEALTLHRRE